jgi:hypothetical protein
MLLRTHNEERAAWHLAAYRGEEDVMQKIWEWAEEKLTTKGIKNEMLLRTDNEGGTAWHLAAYRGEQDVMQKIWEWAEEKLTTERQRMKCYYALAMREGPLGILQHTKANKI